MSAGSLNGATLNLSKLTVGGQPVEGGAGTLLSLSGSATGSVPTTAGVVNVSVASSAQTGVLTTASTMVLPPAGGSGGGGIPSLTTTPATAGTGAVSTAFSATVSRNAGTDTAVFTASPGAMALALNITPGTGGGGITTLTGTGGTPTTGSSIAFTSTVSSGSTTALSFVPSANGMVLSGTVASGGGGGGLVLAYGTLAMNAQGAGGQGTVGRLSGTLTPPEVQLVAVGGTLPAELTTDMRWGVSWAGGSVAPPAQSAIAPAPISAGVATTATFNCAGAILAGANLNWVLYG